MVKCRLDKLSDGSYKIIVELGRDPETGKRERIRMIAKDPITGKKLNARDSNTLMLDVAKNPDKYKKKNEEPEPAPEPEPEPEPTKEMTVADMLRLWLPAHVNRKRKKIGVGTQIGYQLIIDVHLISSLGSIILTQLTAVDLDQYYTKAMNGEIPGREKISERTAFSHHSLLSTALEWAVQKGLIDKNPAKSCDPPNKCQRVIMNAKSEDETADFLNFLKTKPEYPLFEVDFVSGLRRSELLALTEYSLRPDCLYIDQAILKYTKEKLEEAGDRWIDEFMTYMPGRYTTEQLQRLHALGFIIKKPKSEKGIRSIPYDNETYTMLKNLAKKNKENKLRFGPKYHDLKLLFCQNSGLPLPPNSLSRKMKQYADEYGFTMRLHDIRHTFVTLALKNDARTNVAQELAGHKHASTTLDIYGHVLPGEKEDAVSTVRSKILRR